MLVAPKDEVEEVGQQVFARVALAAVPRSVLVQHQHVEPIVLELGRHLEVNLSEGSVGGGPS